ncbi:MAG TPA: crotonase/enoyl-CoA hydratase family protein [Methylophilaceae bacterium]|nr:crotonase/enoyl-CoA hydratase family protein [Methylophilaceae bacterium]
MNTVVDFNQLNNAQYKQIDTRFDDEYGVIWSIMHPAPRPCFNKVCLTELLHHQKQIRKNNGLVSEKGKTKQINYHVFSSNIDGIFNLGGDLSIFKQLILAKDRDGLLEYAELCIDNVWTFYNMQEPVTTISLVQGQAMGGGFEAALSAHIMIAERSAVMGLPEVLFNLFPGMGALSFLSRKIGLPEAERLVRSGKTYTAEELYKIGVVDVLAEDGQGEFAMNNWIKRNHKALNSNQAITRAAQRVNPLNYEELYDITLTWVNAALNLDERNLKVMERLIRAQNTKASEDVSSIANKQTA